MRRPRRLRDTAVPSTPKAPSVALLSCSHCMAFMPTGTGSSSRAQQEAVQSSPSCCSYTAGSRTASHGQAPAAREARDLTCLLRVCWFGQNRAWLLRKAPRMDAKAPSPLTAVLPGVFFKRAFLIRVYFICFLSSVQLTVSPFCVLSEGLDVKASIRIISM